MTKKQFVMMLIFSWLWVGCTSSSSNTPAPTSPVTPITDNAAQAPDGVNARVFIRVQNDTGVDLESVNIAFPAISVGTGAIQANAITEYFLFNEAYQSPSLEVVTVDGKSYESNNLDMPAETGEPPITAGNYTLFISLQNNNLVYGELIVDTQVTDTMLVPFMMQLRDAGVDASTEPIMQRGTVFDSLMGETISQQAILRVNEQRLNVYIFDTSDIAGEMADSIQAGGSLFRLVGDDGEAVTESMSTSIGSAPQWWLTDNMLINYNGSDDAIINLVTEILGDSINAQRFADMEGEGVRVRVLNLSNTDFTKVVIRYGENGVDYGAVPAFSTSAYQPHELATNQANYELEWDSGSTQAILEPAEPMVVNAGNYTLVLKHGANNAVRQAIIRDDEFFVDNALIDQDWYWTHTILPDQTEFTPSVFTESDDYPFIRFNTDTSPNDGEAGFTFSLFTGCNHGFGTHFLNEFNQLVIQGVGQTLIGCDGNVAESERLFTSGMTGISSYFVEGNTLEIINNEGRFYFTAEKPASTASYPTIGAPNELVYHTGAGMWHGIMFVENPPYFSPTDHFSMNPAATHALRFERQENGTITGLMGVEMASATETPLPLDVIIPRSTVTWMNNEQVVIGHWESREDEGPNGGRPALLNMITGEFTPLDPAPILYAPPTIAQDGTVVGNPILPADKQAIYVWQDGVLSQEIMLEDIVIDLDVPAITRLGSPAVAPDGKSVAVTVSFPPDDNGETNHAYAILDLGSLRLTVFSPRFTTPRMGGWTTVAEWNNAGDYFMVKPWTSDETMAGLWLFSREPDHDYYFGNGTSQGMWLNDSNVVFMTWNNEIGQMHTFNIPTEQRYHIDASPTARLLYVMP